MTEHARRAILRAAELAGSGRLRSAPHLYGLIFGAVVGALPGVLLHAAQGGRRNIASVRSMEPSRYDVVVDEDVADEAVRLVAGLDSRAGANTESASSKGGRPRSDPASS